MEANDPNFTVPKRIGAIMPYFAIAEVDDGYTIIELAADENAEDAAARQGGTLVDAGPYDSYERACDAFDELESNKDDLNEA